MRAPRRQISNGRRNFRGRNRTRYNLKRNNRFRRFNNRNNNNFNNRRRNNNFNNNNNKRRFQFRRRLGRRGKLTTEKLDNDLDNKEKIIKIILIMN